MKHFESILTPPQSLDRFTFDLQRFADLNSLSHDGNTYYITSVADLKTLSAYVNDNHDCSGLIFKQTQDITFQNSDGNFSAIGYLDSNFDYNTLTPTIIDYPFKGTYNGGGKKIENLKISGGDYQGLFGYVGVGGTVKDVHLVNANISGSDSVGGLVGYNHWGTIENCTTTNGSVSGNEDVGGLVGFNESGTVKNSLLDGGTVSSNKAIGNNYGGTVSGYYHATAITGATKVYLLTLPEGVTASGTDGKLHTFGGKYYAETGATITLSGVDGSLKDSDGNAISGNSYTMPAQDSTLIEGITLNLNFVEDGQYYEISSVDDLKTLSAYVNDGNDCSGLTFKQTADIVFDTVEDGQSNFTAIGYYVYDEDTETEIDCPFKGTYDGRDFTIKNLTINSTKYFQGLFGYVDEGGTIQNVNLVNAEISGNSQVGGLVGENYGGTVSGTVTGGTVSGNWVVGGLVGENYGGTVSGTVTGGTVSGSWYVGGLVGDNSGTVNNCTTTGGSVTGEYDVAGIVGYNNGTISSCLVDGVEVSGIDDDDYQCVGGIAGYNEGTIENCTTTGNTVSGTGTCVGGLVGYNYGTVSGSITEGDTVRGKDYVGGLVGENYFGTVKNSLVDDGSVTSTGNKVGSFVGHNYDGGTVTGYYHKLTNGFKGAGTATEVFTITLPENVTATGGDPITFGEKNYYAKNAEITLKTGYLFNGSSTVTVDEDKTISATFDDTKHYVFGNATDGYTLATAENTTTYPDLIQVYAVTLNGVTTTTQPVIAGTNYYFPNTTISLSTKLGYKADSSYKVTADKTISASLDTANHYVFGNETEGYTLATDQNIATAGYPNLKQVYEITLPANVTPNPAPKATTANGKNYYFSGTKITLSGNKINDNASYAIDGTNTYTVTKDEEIKPTIYISVSGGEYSNTDAKISVIGSAADETLINTANNVTLDGGLGNDSLVGSDNKEVFVYSGGIDSIKSFTATEDQIHLANGFSVSGIPQAVSNDLEINFGGSDKLIIEGAAALNKIDLYNADGSEPQTMPVENIIFNNDDHSKATSATVKSAYGDLGKQKANRTETYAKVVTITASQEDSTIVGNAKNNKIIVEGGSDNILTGGLGKDTYNFTEGGGIITDFGIGATKSGDGKKLATSTTSKTYDREDPETYACGTDVVRVNGKVSGIYFERDGDTSQDTTFTAVITYNDGTDEQIVVLDNIAKKPTKTNSNPDKAVYQTNDVAAATLKIWDTSGNKHGTLSAAKLKKLFKDDDELTATQQERVDHLTELIKPATEIVTPADSQTPSVGLRSTQIAFNSNKSKN